MPFQSASAMALIRRPLFAGLVLLLAYGALSLLMDPDGTLGADTGAKVATLETMSQRDSWSVDVGYWAEEWDPSGRVHPIFQASRTDDGWAAVTTVPMLLAAFPLYELGGYRLTLLLPMLGAVGCAFVARGLARRLGAQHDGWPAFWVIGLGSPFVVYALDLWEHAVGVALIGGAALLLLDVVSSRAWLVRSVASGAMLGGAATMRTEALVYAAVIVGGAVYHLAVLRGRWRPAAGVGTVAIVAFAGPWFANQLLERAVGGISRSERASGAAGTSTSAAGGLVSTVWERLGEGMVTLVGFRGDGASSAVAGLGLLALVGLAARALRHGDARLARIAMLGLAAVYVIAGITNPGFIPGLLLAFPAALMAIRAVKGPGEARWLALVAIAALPVVWAFQYLGAAGPQWGGRYSLATALLLGSLGVAGLRKDDSLVARGLIGLSCVVAAVGIAFMSYRTHSVASFFDTVSALDAEVVIARDAFLIREGGGRTVGRHWLSAASEDDFAFALGVARESGADRVAVLSYREPAPPEGSVPPDLREVERGRADVIGVPIGITIYVVEPDAVPQ